MPYSAVIHPTPWPRIQPGTDSSTIAVQITRVAPAVTSTEPVADEMKSTSNVRGRISSARRPSGRIPRAYLRLRPQLQAEVDELRRLDRRRARP